MAPLPYMMTNYFSPRPYAVPKFVEPRRIGALARDCERIMRTRGRAIGTTMDSQGRVCALGAMMIAVGGEHAMVQGGTRQSIEFEALGMAYFNMVGRSPHVHNDSCLLDEPVLEVFRRIAEYYDPLTRLRETTEKLVPLGQQEDHELAGGPSS